MPFFADIHPGGEVSIEVLVAALRAACARRLGPAGARPVDYHVGTDGRLTCVVEAPDAAAVRHLHAALGLPCRHIRQVPPPSEPA